MNNPICSVIIPVRNREKLIENCIRSALNQTVQDIEIIVIDDASTDGTKLVVKSLIEEDSRVILIENSTNTGAAQARNIGIQRAKAEWIALLDSDDYWKSDKLEKEFQALKTEEADIVCTSANTVDQDGNIMQRVFNSPQYVDLKVMLRGNDVVTSSMLVRKALLEKYPFVCGKLHEDYVFLISALRDNIKIACIHEPLTVYRIHKDALTGNKLHSMVLTRNSYKEVGLNLFQRSYYLCMNAIHGVKKHLL